MTEPTPDIDIGDLIRDLAGDEPAGDEEPAIAEQLRPPSSNELAEIEKIAAEAAALQDELRQQPYDDRPKRLKALKADLLERMQNHGMKELKIHGRPAIEVTSSRSTKPTRKNLVVAMQKLLEDDKKGKQEAFKIWNAIPMSTSHSVKIPDPAPEPSDVELPY